MRLDESDDIGFELGGGPVDAALELLAGELGEPAFDLVDPRGRRRCKMNMPMRPACQPGLDPRRLVRGIVVHHEMHIGSLGHRGVNPPEKIEKLGCPMAFVALSDHRPCGDVERREQRGRAVANIGVGAPLRDARRHRQDRLFAIERLDLGFFIHTQHDRPVRR